MTGEPHSFGQTPEMESNRPSAGPIGIVIELLRAAVLVQVPFQLLPASMGAEIRDSLQSFERNPATHAPNQQIAATLQSAVPRVAEPCLELFEVLSNGRDVGSFSWPQHSRKQWQSGKELWL